MNNTVDIIIPVYKPDQSFQKLLDMLAVQSVKPNKIIIMHSKENDDLTAYTLPEQVEIHEIEKKDFDHGHTRNLGVGYSKSGFFICMTQDAIPCDDKLIETLISGMDESVRMCYARQIARKNAGEIEKITRSFNYPDESRIKNQGYI